MFYKITFILLFWANNIIQFFILPCLDPSILLIVMDEKILIGQQIKYVPYRIILL